VLDDAVTVDTGESLGTIALDLGDATHLALTAGADFDADGVVETNAAEIAGLTGYAVTLGLFVDTTVVVTVNGVSYRSAG
jgi:hypothetical protein